MDARGGVRRRLCAGARNLQHNGPAAQRALQVPPYDESAGKYLFATVCLFVCMVVLINLFFYLLIYAHFIPALF
jgi:hypothetical protein